MLAGAALMDWPARAAVLHPWVQGKMCQNAQGPKARLRTIPKQVALTRLLRRLQASSSGPVSWCLKLHSMYSCRGHDRIISGLQYLQAAVLHRKILKSWTQCSLSCI